MNKISRFKRAPQPVDILKIHPTIDNERISSSLGKDLYGTGQAEDCRPYISNHSGYSRAGSESWEHDSTGDKHNYSAMEDEAVNALIDNEGWDAGYNYDSRK